MGSRPTFPCAKYFHDGDVVVHDPQGTFRFELSTTRRDELRAYLEASFADARDPYQAFCRNYVGIVGHGPDRWPRALNRFALCFDLIDHLLPPEGLWVDVGSMGFETLAMRKRRPDMRSRQFCWEGGAIDFDDAGMHYTTEPSETCVVLERCDLERDALPLDSDSVDVMSALEVIEHFKFGPQHFMVEANRVLKPGGYLIITTPNAHSAHAFERLALNDHPAECALYHRELEHGRIHPSEYARDQMWAIAHFNGFKIDSLVTFDGAPSSPRLLRITEKLQYVRHSEGMTSAPDFGEKWLLIAHKIDRVTGPAYPTQIFD